LVNVPGTALGGGYGERQGAQPLPTEPGVGPQDEAHRRPGRPQPLHRQGENHPGMLGAIDLRGPQIRHQQQQAAVAGDAPPPKLTSSLRRFNAENSTLFAVQFRENVPEDMGNREEQHAGAEGRCSRQRRPGHLSSQGEGWDGGGVRCPFQPVPTLFSS